VAVVALRSILLLKVSMRSIINVLRKALLVLLCLMSSPQIGIGQDGVSATGEDEVESEISTLSKAISERPSEAGNYIERAKLYWSQGKRELADADLQVARRLDLYPAQVAQAELWNGAGERRKAYELLSVAISSKPTRHEAYVARSYCAKDEEAALGDLTKGISLFEDKKSHAYYLCLYDRADMLFDLGRYTESIQDVNAAIEWNNSTIAAYAAQGLKFPRNPVLYYLRGSAKAKLDQNLDAISDFTTSESAGLRWPMLYSARADCYRKVGDKVREQADRELAKKVSQEPSRE